jgi:ferredoxin
MPALLKQQLLFGPELEPRGAIRDDYGDGMIGLEELTRLYEEQEIRWMLVALCGPGFVRNGYLRVPVGADWGNALAPFLREVGWRLVEEDPLTGSRIADLSRSIYPGTRKVFALLEGPYEEFFPRLRPGSDRDSWFRGFVSGLFPGQKRLVTSLQGEEGACFSCGACSSGCPAGLYRQHKNGTGKDGEEPGETGCLSAPWQRLAKRGTASAEKGQDLLRRPVPHLLTSGIRRTSSAIWLRLCSLFFPP